MAEEPQESNALSVSQAMQIAKRQLEDVTLKVIGEVSEYSANSRYKAVYFTIKDEKSSLPCMMWKNRFDASATPIVIGSLVELTGRFTLYPAKGRMNFDVFSIELAGEGKLRLQVANLAKKLEAEGLMNPNLKKPIPQFPEKIGLVTSPRGAAVYDVLRTLRRRYPTAKVLFAGVGVEGVKAPSEMSAALKAVQDAGAEVILLVRGGGSFEDLMPFNDESLARAIFSMEVPIVTGIGHEPDTSIADMVSDRRASTPTAAAESVAPSSIDLSAGIQNQFERLTRMLVDRLSKTSMVLEGISNKPVFADPLRMFDVEARFLDDSLARLSAAIPNTISEYHVKLSIANAYLKSGLSNLCVPFANRKNLANSKMQMIGAKIFEKYKTTLATKAASLEALSPLEVLTRGYSIARDEKGAVIKSTKGIAPDDSISVQLKDGSLSCCVNSIEEKEYALEEINVN